MMESLKKPAARRLWKVLLFVVFLIVGLAAAFDFYYDLNDDTTIKDIISGAYTGVPSGYSVQMLYPLSFCVSLLYRAIPGIPWYGLFLCVCQFASAGLIAWRVTGLVKKDWQQLWALFFEGIVFIGLLVRQLVIVQYSVTSGICMATAVFLYVTGKDQGTPEKYVRQNLIPILLVIVSFMIRTEMCIMLLPFVLLAGFSQWMSQEKIFTVNQCKRYFYVIGMAALGMAAVFAMDRVSVMGSKERDAWSAFQSFFDARTSLYDFYGLPPYEKNKAFYEDIGLSRESYRLLENYNFSLDESIDEHLLRELVAFQEQNAGISNGLVNTAGFISRNNLKGALWLYQKRVVHMESGVYAYLLLAAYISYVLIAGGRKKSGCYWKIALLLVIRSILWIYLFMVDRVLDRITIPLLVTEIILLLSWIIQESLQAKADSKDFASIKLLAIGSYALLGICALLAMGTNIGKTAAECADRERVNPRWEALISYCQEHKENYYVVDVYSSTSYEGVPYAEKIFVNADASYRNFDLCGGWLAKSPLMYEKLARMQMENVESALIKGEQAYFIAAPDKELTWLTDYYAFKGKTIQTERVDTIELGETECFIVYRLVAHT